MWKKALIVLALLVAMSGSCFAQLHVIVFAGPNDIQASQTLVLFSWGDLEDPDTDWVDLVYLGNDVWQATSADAENVNASAMICSSLVPVDPENTWIQFYDGVLGVVWWTL